MAINRALFNSLIGAFIFLNASAGICQISQDHFSKKDVGKFCTETASHGMYQQFVLWKDGSRFQNDAELTQALKQGPEAVDGSSWMFSTYPDSKMRLHAYQHKFFSDYDGKQPLSDEDLVKIFSDEKNDLASRALSAYIGKHNILDLLKQSADQKDSFQMSSSSLSRSFICSTYGLFQMPACSDALQILHEFMAPRSSIMAIPVVAEVLSNYSYVKGASLAALKIMNRVKNGNLISGDLLSDIKNSYIESGLNLQQAEEHTWNLIAAWATRGPTVGSYILYTSKENIRTVLALLIIGTAAPYLDQLRIEKGFRPYSYPNSIKTTCSFGKPYHFWMSAFLARKLGQDVSNAQAGRTAAFLAEIGYQIFSKTVGRDPTRVFTHQAFDPSNNKIRIDVAFGAAGATFGMNTLLNHRANILIDDAIVNEIKAATPLPALNHSEVKYLWEQNYGYTAYARWKKIIAPDAALNSFESL